MRDDFAAYLRTRSLVQTKEFLRALTVPAATPRVPHKVRLDAQALLGNFPTLLEIQRIHEALPDLFGPVPPFPRLEATLETLNAIKATLDAKK